MADARARGPVGIARLERIIMRADTKHYRVMTTTKSAALKGYLLEQLRGEQAGPAPGTA